MTITLHTNRESIPIILAAVHNSLIFAVFVNTNFSGTSLTINGTKPSGIAAPRKLTQEKIYPHTPNFSGPRKLARTSEIKKVASIWDNLNESPSNALDLKIDIGFPQT
jgi:hypothetical protein